MKQILFASSEAIPYIKTGGLADVVGSLPKYIQNDEYEVRIILPKYACMDEKFLSELNYVCHFYVDLNWRKQYAGIFETTHEGVKYYFVDNEYYFAGPNPYNNIHEDVEKFAFFSKAVLSALPYLDYSPGIIHCHDWQTGLIPVFLHTSYGSDVFYSGIKTIFSIHNLKFQGRWKIREVMDVTGLPEYIFDHRGIESYGEANLLKGGCVYADAITTVSPTYASEILTQEGGEGLEGVFSMRKADLHGILNGLDYQLYNPKTDPYIYEPFTVESAIEGKKKNKTALQKEFGLPEREDVFVLGIVSRMTDQKGFDLIAYIMDELLNSMDVQLIVLGTGEIRYEHMFHYFQNAYPQKVGSYIGYSEERAHHIYAGADAFLMPSLFEPCGLSQMMSMRYGTLPIVRETGGLRDTVIAYNEYNHTGTGFSFTEYNALDFLHVIQYANEVYEKQRPHWDDMVKRAMEVDYSWDASAEEYRKIYDGLLDVED
ncbi:MAG: glycogen synthase GlgA [Lachnospiraceae bacterium]|nr:glycogen synthase GlgA [Lachnospiraceae bacterium]